MPTSHRRSRPSLQELSVAVAIASCLVAILWSEPQVARNSGAREKLAHALQTIGRDLAVRQGPLAQNQTGRTFLLQHDVSATWHGEQGYEPLVFKPFALAAEVELSSSSAEPPVPQIVLVPVDQHDDDSMPTLFVDQPLEDRDPPLRQWIQMHGLFQRFGVGDAATLMSDGSVRHIPTSELFAQLEANL